MKNGRAISKYWFNDVPGRIKSALDAGYTHIIDATTQKPIQMVVGVTQQGGPLQGFLMEIPRGVATLRTWRHSK